MDRAQKVLGKYLGEGTSQGEQANLLPILKSLDSQSSRSDEVWQRNHAESGTRNMAHKQKGFSLIELLIVVAIILIIASIAIPNLMKSRQRANEAAAISTLRTLHTSQAAYNTAYGELTGFAGTMKSLGPGTPCDPTHACLVDASLGCASEPCVRGGYEFFLASDSSSSPFTDYAFTATPVVWKSSGNQNFCSAEDGMIRFETSPSGQLSAAVPHDNCMNFALYDGI